MRAPKRKRELPRTLCRVLPEDVTLKALAGKVRYVGSPEHKAHPSPAGAPRLRADASKCDPSFKERFEDIGTSLKEAVLQRNIGNDWENGFPRYVWGRIDDTWYEARLVNSGKGEYKGYPLLPSELPKGLVDDATI